MGTPPPPLLRLSPPAPLSELAGRLGATLVGPDLTVDHLASLEDVQPGGLSVYEGGRYAPQLAGCRASALVVASVEAGFAGPQLVCASPVLLFFSLVGTSLATPTPAPGIHPTAVIAPTACLSPSARIGPLCVVEEGADIGEGAVLEAQVYVGRGAHIGAGSLLRAGVRVLERVWIGARVRVDAGAVLGSEGFGYRWDGAAHRHLPHGGTVIVEDDVEIGAGTCIDRAALGATVIGRGSRIDNLCQIGHGVHIGPSSLIAAQSGVAGSARLGAFVRLGGQVGIADHAQLGHHVQIAAKSGVSGRVADHEILAGIPAIPIRTWRRLVASWAVRRTKGPDRG